MKNTILLSLSALLCVTAAAYADSHGEPGRSTGKANPLNNVYFGEQHLHTSDSADAFAMGTKNTLDDAYNFCKGKAVKKSITGEMVQKKTPYDWCAVTDHAYLLGLLPQTLDPKSPLSKSKIGKLIASGKSSDMDKAFGLMMKANQAGKTPEGFDDMEVQQSAWEKQKQITNKHNDPGKFTTLIAFEWTSLPNGQNLHRNVFFRDEQGPDVPFSAMDSDNAEDLWTYLEVQRKMGHETFAIPHNSNVSNGMMFPPSQSSGAPIDMTWAKRRALNEVAVEMVQCKGQSETNPALSPNDEFADFEQFKNLLGLTGIIGKVDHSFVRRAWTDGVGYQTLIGANPFKFGAVGGGDSHTAFAVNEEFNYSGVHGVNDNTPKARLSGAGQTAGEPALNFGSPGATAVWAPENTREAIFDGIKRKETYATSGPLIRLRFFGGWDYAEDLVKDKGFVKTAYETGVPMGQDLKKKPEKAKAPSFVVWALKDPDSGNLDRIQIIKGWYENGHPKEKIYDVAWSDERKIDTKTGKLSPVGNSVNISKATYSDTIGATELSTVWTDPDFDAGQNAVYYTRVIEIPTPRWSTYDAAKLGIPVPTEVPATIQERAWSSPIWYSAEKDIAKKSKFYPGLQRYIP